MFVMAAVASAPGCDISMAGQLLAGKDAELGRSDRKEWRVYDFEFSSDYGNGPFRFVDLSAFLGHSLDGVLAMWKPKYVLMPMHYGKNMYLYLAILASQFDSAVYVYDDEGNVTSPARSS
jgi:hypothetical protein